MFYCDSCGTKKGWPINTLFKSMGACEICNKVSACNDVPSKYLPVPKAKLGGDNDEEISPMDIV